MKDRLALPVLSNPRSNNSRRRLRQRRRSSEDDDGDVTMKSSPHRPSHRANGDNDDVNKNDMDDHDDDEEMKPSAETSMDKSDDGDADEGDDSSGESEDSGDDDDAYYGCGIRCPTGSAVITGPNRYGSLAVPFVVHAVGPSYFSFDNFEEPDQLLRSAYIASLDRCQENGIADVAFSLLSAGIFRGNRKLGTVLQIGVEAIRDWAENGMFDFRLDSGYGEM